MDEFVNDKELGELQREYGDKADPGPSSHIFIESSLKKLLHDPDVPNGAITTLQSTFDVQPGGNFKIGSIDKDEVITIRTFLAMGLQGDICPYRSRDK
ncbi:unnamed protein product [Arabis nemorensis]|uniref:Uncharacterized protein n=1 Tax=Arabis nemorensis TaxID=586526 RepID=A0A565BEP5_9BRAS|nr:unnamed protein product [Arabis nemorensis]